MMFQLSSLRATPGRPAANLLRGIVCLLFFYAVAAGHADDRKTTSGPSSASAHALQQLAYRDRQVETTLRWLQTQPAAGEDLAVLERVQFVLNLGEDSFVGDADSAGAGGQLSSARQLVTDWVDAAPADFIVRYRQVYGAEARRLLQEARSARDPARFREITRRFFHTPAGLAAADWLCTYWLDRGFPELSARLSLNVLSCPHHADHVRAHMLLKAGIAARLSGNAELDRLVEERLSQFNENVFVGGREQDLPAVIASGAAKQIEHSERGNVRHSGTGIVAFRTADSVPLSGADWAVDRFSPNSSAVDEMISNWEREQRSRYAPVAAALVPVVANGQVIFRDESGVRGVELRSGRTAWRYRSPYPTSERLNRGKESAATGSPASLQEFEKALAGSAVEGVLATDGRQVYVVENAHLSSTAARKFGNRLITLTPPHHSAGDISEVAPCWKFPADEGTDDYVLGVPLPAAGQLFTMLERRGQLEIVSLDPETGRVNWSQPVAIAEIPIDMDTGRQGLQCTPAYQSGVVVCPTQLGILVGLDAYDGRLLWAYHYGDELELYQSRGRHYSSRSTTGHTGFPSVPLVRDGAVYYLPRHSSWMHCVDLNTGTVRWRVPRGDAEYLGTISHQRLVVVGRSTVKAFAAETGEVVWSVPGEVPSGIGLQVGEVYLVPQTDAEPLQVNLETGERSGLPFRVRDDVRLGHLMAYEGMVISSTLAEVSAFPEAARELNRISQELSTTESPEAHLKAAEVCLSLSSIDQADDHLSAALQGVLTPELEARARRLMRDLLYYRLTLPSTNRDVIFARLEPLADSAVERARYWMHVSEARSQERDFHTVLEAIDELSRLNVRHPLPLPGNASAATSPGTWVRRQIRELQQRDDVNWNDAFRDYVQRRQAETLANADPAEMAAFLTAFSDTEEAHEVAYRLGHLLRQAGDTHAAEMVLDRVISQVTPEDAAQAIALRHGLWVGAGFAVASPGQPADSAPWQLAESGRTRGFVQIRESSSIPTSIPIDPWSRGYERSSDAYVAFGGIYNRYRRRLSPPQDFGHDLLVKPTDDESVLVAIDRASGGLRAEFRLPLQYEYPKDSKMGYHGHFFSLAAAGEILGYSVLEPNGGEPVWRQSPQEIAGRQDVPRIGPAGASYAVFQTRDHLFVLNPTNGDVLWRQSGLPTPAGLFLESSSGLFGDAQALVVVGPDRQAYQVYETMTGRLIRSGELAGEQRHSREIFGRNMLFTRNASSGGSGENSPQLVLWDPLTDRVLFEQQISHGKPMSSQLSDHELAVVGEDDIKIINPQTGEILGQVSLGSVELAELSYFRAFGDGRHYYLNLQRTKRRLPGSGSSYISNPFIPVTLVRDDLYCVERTTGKILWKRAVPQRTVLTPQAGNDLPVLVLLSQSSKAYRYDRSQKGLLIEVLDRTTGEILAARNDLTLDRILQAEFDPDRGLIELFGQKTVYQIQLPPRSGAAASAAR